ncbi:type III-A CRISPR-associated protein Cas10/Csm1 [Desulfurispira natronophila]|uniref:CRISPR system single-strand-specific deoxyribonuclease Cas10/Csm1 (subtype III-A) n=1 Tax=Desulfurispira natronophila TaxID=682562 RepID=A0A7W8DHB2_9BACT|nr:type III-A CRISPR-associated protein Cas10/Csm1 [Desulfurispira natronophila]MBB5022244.1 CRISPR-associated protein Csm1 [Desulfurispira natronophila]
MSDTSPLSRAYTIATAGLLHDIGKFLQRSGKKLLKADDYNYAYGTKHGYGHVHAAFTGLFFDGKITFSGAENQEIKAFYDNILQAFPWIEQNDHETSLANLAANHHKVGNQSHPLQWIIAEADRLASGFERDKSDEHYKAYAEALAKEEQKPTHANTHMRNIFSDVQLTKRDKPTESFYPFRSLEPAILPITSATTEKSEASEDYTHLLTGFAEGLSSIARRLGATKQAKDKHYSLANTYLALATLMERHCWSIPSATVSYESGKFVPTPTNISLYDHSRATSAIATALYAWHQEEDDIDHAQAGQLVEKVKDREAEKFCFIQGDFSGIQHFIFDAGGESNKFAAKILRAKSFYVSMATEAAAHAICHKLNLPLSSIVMNAGGKFTILAANTNNVQDAVQSVRETINKHFHNLTFGQTRFNLATLPFAPEKLVMREYAELMSQLAHALECEKLRPQISEPVFDDYLRSRNDRELCTVCGKHWGDETKYGIICCHCNHFRRLGEALVRSGEDRSYFHLSTTEHDKTETEDKQTQFPLFGTWGFAFGKSPDLSAPTYNIDRQDTFSGFAHKHLANYVPRWKNDEEWEQQRYFSVNKKIQQENEGKQEQSAELKINATKTFAHIGADALHEEENGKLRGVAHLGVLKADVDHLGQIFSRGFTVEKVSYANMSRMSMLSRMLDYFFTGWLPWRLAKEPEGGEIDYRSVYTVFAGGDDLFLIGPWNRIVDLAGEIDQHLRQYTGGNPDIHLSAGIVLRKAAIPVREMAHDGEEALEQAKDGDGPEAGSNRNRITVFDQTVTWGEYKELKRSGDALKLQTQSMGSELSTQYLYGLLKFSQDAATATTFPESPEEVNAWMEAAKWRARLKYRHQRYFVEKSKKEETKLEAMEFVFKDIQENTSKMSIPLSRLLYDRRRR